MTEEGQKGREWDADRHTKRVKIKGKTNDPARIETSGPLTFEIYVLQVISAGEQFAKVLH